MRINILKPLKTDEKNKYKFYELVDKDIYITKLDFFHGGLKFCLECSKSPTPYDFRLEEVESLKYYQIKNQDGDQELFLIEITDSTGILFD